MNDEYENNADTSDPGDGSDAVSGSHLKETVMAGTTKRTEQQGSSMAQSTKRSQQPPRPPDIRARREGEANTEGLPNIRNEILAEMRLRDEVDVEISGFMEVIDICAALNRMGFTIEQKMHIWDKVLAPTLAKVFGPGSGKDGFLGSQKMFILAEKLASSHLFMAEHVKGPKVTFAEELALSQARRDGMSLIPR